MAIINAKVCSNCRRFVPDFCDGKVYRAETSVGPRRVCIGKVGNELRYVDGKLMFNVVMGHGCSYDVATVEEMPVPPPDRMFPY